MTSPVLRSEVLQDLIETLVGETRPEARLRRLLEAAAGDGRAAAIWRPLGSSPVATWQPVLARGPEAFLPPSPQVHAVLAGVLSPQLPHGARVVVAGTGAQRVALVLGGPGLDERVADTLEALLWVLAAVDDAEVDSPLEGPLAPFGTGLASGESETDMRLRPNPADRLLDALADWQAGRDDSAPALLVDLEPSVVLCETDLADATPQALLEALLRRAGHALDAGARARLEAFADRTEPRALILCLEVAPQPAQEDEPGDLASFDAGEGNTLRERELPTGGRRWELRLPPR